MSKTLDDVFAQILDDIGSHRKGSRVDKALTLLIRYGATDGEHHKTWCIDQAVRALAGKRYADLIKARKAGEDGPDTYGWDEGIAP